MTLSVHEILKLTWVSWVRGYANTSSGCSGYKEWSRRTPLPPAAAQRPDSSTTEIAHQMPSFLMITQFTVLDSKYIARLKGSKLVIWSYKNLVSSIYKIHDRPSDRFIWGPCRRLPHPWSHVDAQCGYWYAITAARIAMLSSLLRGILLHWCFGHFMQNWASTDNDHCTNQACNWQATDRYWWLHLYNRSWCLASWLATARALAVQALHKYGVCAISRASTWVWTFNLWSYLDKYKYPIPCVTCGARSVNIPHNYYHIINFIQCHPSMIAKVH